MTTTSRTSGRPAAQAPSPLDDRARAVVEGLQARNRRQTRAAVGPLIVRAVRSRLRDGTWDPTQSPATRAWLADKLVALDPSKAALCYQLCRALGARRVVEAGTSYGLSTIYLAAAVRDNIAAAAALAESRDARRGAEPDDGGAAAGVVIGTEHEPSKVAFAHANLTEAGLADHADIREGDLRETLRDLPGPVDFMLVDIWIPMALPALRLVTPHLRPGALVVCDNVVSGRRYYAEYLDHVRDPGGPFTSVTVPGNGGLEISLRN
ncbi:O-methyltransferase [Parafrankia sp. FMc2]|uniref:O-methyltransferase n=1 Tax=Parafrankia sp. FMc2 TaxID=3233196 RepID=UPI0034D4CF1C